MLLTKAKKEELRNRCRTDLFFLAKTIFGKGLTERTHRPVTDFFVKKTNVGLPENYTQEELQSYLIQLDSHHVRMLMYPRGFYKSTLDGIDCVQWVINFPDIRILILTGEYSLAEQFMFEIRKYFTIVPKATRSLFQQLFPEFCIPAGEGSNLEFRCPAAHLGLPAPTIWINSIEATLSGWHCDIIKADDVVTDRNSITASNREKVIARFDGARELLDPHGFLDLIGTRYAVDDLYGVMLQRNVGLDDHDLKYYCDSAWKRLPHVSKDKPILELTKDDVELRFPEKFTFKVLRDKLIANEMLFRCFPAKSSVLMADWSEKNIENVKPGDEVIGFTEKGLQKSIVTHVHTKKDIVIKATTETDRVIFTTKDHKFLSPRNGDKLQFSKLKIGKKVVSVYTPSISPVNEEQRLWDWLGGILDGEGSCDHQLCIYQSESTNPETCSVIRKRLKFLNIPFKECLDKRRNVIQFKLEGGRSLKIRFIQHTLMSKKQRIIDSLWTKSNRFIGESFGRRGGSSYQTIVKIEEMNEQPVYTLTTDTGVYVCQGFAVRNCQQLNEPVFSIDTIFDIYSLRTATISPNSFPADGEIYIAWDWAHTTNEKSNYSVGVVAKKDAQDRLFILDMVRGKFRPDELAYQVVKLIQMYSPRRTMIEETNGAGFFKLEITRLAAAMHVALNLDWIPVDVHAQAKLDRVRGLQPLITTGRFFFSSTLSQMDKIYDEFTKFTGTKGREDDIPDACSFLLRLLPKYFSYRELKEAEITAQQSARDKQLYKELFPEPEPEPLEISQVLDIDNWLESDERVF